MSHPGAPLLMDTVEVLLPDRQETLFLKACLGVDTDASWRDLRAGVPDLKTIVAGAPAYRRLLPLLAFSLAQAGVAVPQDDLVLLRAAAAWEQRRAARVDALLADILDALREVSVAPVVVKGVALAHLAYPKPSLRHCHDIDLLVPLSQHGVAAEAITRVGFDVKAPAAPEDARLVLVHADGLPVTLHAGLISQPSASPRTTRTGLAGTTARILEPGELLLLMAAQLLAGRMRDRTSWVADAVFLLRRTPAIDWTALARDATDRGLALVLLAMLAYLRAELDAPVPEAAIAHLGDEARQTRAARDRLLFRLRRNTGVGSGQMFRRSGWRSRLDIVRWIAVPSTAYMRSWCREKGLRWSLAWYVLRPFRRLSLQLRAVSGTTRNAGKEPMS